MFFYVVSPVMRLPEFCLLLFTDNNYWYGSATAGLGRSTLHCNKAASLKFVPRNMHVSTSTHRYTMHCFHSKASHGRQCACSQDIDKPTAFVSTKHSVPKHITNHIARLHLAWEVAAFKSTHKEAHTHSCWYKPKHRGRHAVDRHDFR